VLQHHHIQVKSDIYALAQLQEWFRQLQNFLPKPIWMQCNLVLVEVFTNVVSYAHAELPEETPVNIEVAIDGIQEYLELRIWDFGEPFDLQAAIEKATIQSQNNHNFKSVDDIPTGGRGLMIAQAVADEIRYEHHPDGRNCFVMNKKFGKGKLTLQP